MALKKIPDFMKPENNGKEENVNSNNKTLVCIGIGNKVEYISIIEAAIIANSIITQLSLIGDGIVGSGSTGENQTNISRKTGCGT